MASPWSEDALYSPDPPFSLEEGLGMRLNSNLLHMFRLSKFLLDSKAGK